jgi:hypothetical protein
MKQIRSVLFFGLVILSACKQPALVIKNGNTSLRLTHGDTVAPLLKSANIDFSNCDTFPVSFWGIDSIFSNRIIFKKEISFTHDTVDRMEIKQLIKEDPQQFKYYRAHWVDDYTDGHTVYRICRIPAETLRRSIPVDSLVGVATRTAYTDCDGHFKAFLLSFSQKQNKLFRYNFENCQVSIKNGY